MRLKKLLLATILVAGTNFVQAQHTIQKIWQTTENIPTPESVLFDASSKTLFVSLIDGDGNAKDGVGGVAKLNLDGSVNNLNWVAGLNAPKGLGIYKNKMYVADLTEVVVIDIKKGEVIKKIEVPETVFLNDITVDDKGVVYVSDTRKNKVFRIINDKPELFLENATNANGLKAIGQDLYVLAGPELWKVDQAKKITKIAVGFEKGGDGLEPVGNGDFIVSCWPGLVYYVYADGKFDKMLDTQAEKINTADIGYDAKNKIIYIPTFLKNGVMAYQLK
jgi:hypothetical protein